MSSRGEDWPGRLHADAPPESASEAVARFGAETTEFVARVFVIGGSGALVGLLALRFLATDYWSDQRMGMILLVAMVGAIVLTLRHKEGVKRQSISAQVARTPETAIEVVEVETGKGI